VPCRGEIANTTDNKEKEELLWSHGEGKEKKIIFRTPDNIIA
jgi:hypothetical protein